ncbi:MAG: hypothetical protein ACLQIB_23820 [Isosphaeraceae bacterium]
MANAFADQLKDLGLRHGEKAGVAVATAVFLLCVVAAASKKTIATTPEEIRKAAQASEGNLNRPEDRTTIIQKLQDKGIKDTSFAKEVDDQVKTLLVADNYKSAREWVTPEPGAGLIRDTPKLIAPSELFAYPGRGGLLVYALDEKGNRIPETEKKDQPRQTRRRRNRRRAAGGMGGMTGGMMGNRKKATKSRADLEREAKAEEERKRRELLGKLVPDDAPPDTAKKDESTEDQGPPAKEIVKGYRWVAITGVLDHEKMRANYREALKNPAVAHPNYLRLDLQRQTLQTDGSWTEWQNVDADANLRILDNLPEHDEELAPDNARPDTLVDPLPFLKAGLWEKVHIASLVPKEKKDVPKSQIGGMGRGMGMMTGDSADMMERMTGGGRMGGGNMADMMKKMSGGRGMMTGAGGAGGMLGGGASESVGDYWKSEEKRVMIRALDFTVEPDNTYRYRVRIVVANPNYKREDINHDVNAKVKELKGPWSEETDPVAMPPDVMPYAMGTMAGGINSDTKVRFQVVRFNLADGVTVPRFFESPPGEIIGEPRTAEVPVSDGSGKKSKTIDFTTHQIVLDASGGGLQSLPGGMVGPALERPVLTLLLRPDGSVAVHNEADDFANEVRKDIKANYDQEIKESGKERKNSVGTGMMGMMGMMGGGMGRGGGRMQGGN